MIDNEFNKFATKNGVTCNYRSFAFIAKEDNKIVGIITGSSYKWSYYFGGVSK